VEQLEIVRWGAIVALGIVVAGWRPRVTGVVHWWLSFSMAVSIVAADGGDQVAAVLSLLLIPVTLTDSRRWHWLPRSAEVSEGEAYRADIARSAFWVIRLQVAVIYLHAAIGRMSAPNWIDGTALYCWLLHPLFGVSYALRPIVEVSLADPLVVVVFTWGGIVFQLLLGTAVLQPRRHWSKWLLLGALFRLWIELNQGLVSFFFSMVGALVLALRPPERGFGILARTAALLHYALRSGERTEAGLGHRRAARAPHQRVAPSLPPDQRGTH